MEHPLLHVFVIHFLTAHLRRHAFPMDRAMFPGNTGAEAVQDERPAWIERLRGSGRLGQVLSPDAGHGARTMAYVVGLTAVAIGVVLLVGGLVNAWSITW